MSDWKVYNFSDCYDFSSGLSKPAKEFGFGYPFLSYKDVFENYFIPSQLDNLVNSTEKEREKCSIMTGDIFLTRTSETDEELGLSSVALKDYPDATFNGFTKRLRPKQGCPLDPKYVGYYLRSTEFRRHVVSMASTTTRASLNNSMLENLSILAPSSQDQESIAEVLSSLDDKIDLIHRQNETIEAMADTLFRQWFIEEAEEDWEEAPLSEVADFLNGLACQKYPPKNELERLPVLKIRELKNGFSESSDWATSNVKEKFIVDNGDIIFSWSASLMVKIWDGEKCVLNQHLFKVTSDQFPKWYYYLWSKHHLDEFITISISHATTMGHIKRGDLDEAMVLIPNRDQLDKMTCQMQPLIDKIIVNNQQIQTLEKLRDTLLPKLMSGEVRVNMNESD